jgi:hypothetical protein
VGDGWGSKAGFEFARRALHSRVEDRVIDPMDLSPAKVGTFDVVLFLGVLYHMRHPLLALERVASVTKDFLLLETHIMNRFRHPMIEFYPNDELSGDPTNWCGPNKAAVEAMLRVVGFKRIESRIHQTGIARRLARATRDRFARGKPFRDEPSSGSPGLPRVAVIVSVTIADHVRCLRVPASPSRSGTRLDDRAHRQHVEPRQRQPRAGEHKRASSRARVRAATSVVAAITTRLIVIVAKRRGL